MSKGKVSILIPSRNEVFLRQTIEDLIKKASGDIEVIAVLDGYWPDPPLPDYKNLIILHRGSPKGMRAAINGAAAVARGDWLMKCDAHCMFERGYDEVLSDNCDQDWIVIPRRFSLDAENWKIDQNGKPPRDYHYLCYPDIHKDHDRGMHGVEWWDRGKQRSDPKYDIDETMSFQGSCWFMSRRHFHDFLHGMSEVGYGSFTQEPQEIGNKTWLGGGKLMTNKKTWYAHLHKGKTYGRMYSTQGLEIEKGHAYSSDFWMGNLWEERKYNIDWLIDRFWPVPTWPDNWKQVYYEERAKLVER